MVHKTQYLIKIAFAFLSGLQIAVSYVSADVPAFVIGSIYSSNKADLTVIDTHYEADIAVLDGGLDQGFRRGMVCLVERGTQSIGELIIIESKSSCSAALILSLSNNYTIQPGDSVRIKTFQNS